MKLLSVPLHLQDPDSADCGPTAVRMVLEYYGIKRTLDELKEKLRYEAVGTSSFDNGSLLLSEGFAVTAVTANPILFPPDLMPMLRDRSALDARITLLGERRPNWAANLATLTKFLDLGGQVRMDIPAFDHIRSSIDAGNPLIALTYAQALGSKQGGFHFMVVDGYRRGPQVHLTNPSPLAIQGWFPLDQLLYAVHCASTSDVDNGVLLIPSPKLLS